MDTHPDKPVTRTARHDQADIKHAAHFLRPARTAATLVLTLLATLAGVSQAHEWPSHSTPRHLPPVQSQDPNGDSAEWAGLLWKGPRSGPPAAPTATDCNRPPQFSEAPDPLPRQQRLAWRHGAAKAAHPATAVAAEAAAAPALAADGARRDRAEPLAQTLAPRAPSQTVEPAAEPVTAGVVDDNADFGSYQAYARRTAHLPLRQRDTSERYLLTVHDAAGRPVPDAQVTLHAAGRAQPLWARTDAGGQVWLHPRVAGITAQLLEVQVHKPGPDGELQGSAILKRGQRDQLQVRLDSALPPQPARLDLVFLVDATGSMADEINKLRRSMQAMADQIAQLPSRPQTCWALVSYRDRGDEYLVRAHDFTSDLAAFQQVLGSLRAGGGGDYPEAVNEALHTAVHRLSWRGDGATRLVVLVGDAPPHLDYGAPFYDDDMQAALARGIKLFAVGASGLDKSGEAVWRQLAQFTGGRFVFLTYANARNPASGPGRETVHEVNNYSVESLDKLVVRLVREELARRTG